ncbi:acetoacetate--CoA ligase [Aeromicrobium ginsengisoli]|uniref:Acetoacetate--CoA ligase n=1 Tax=Aeromicrobium ginsengisoli TaxID=363867 RepID=A0A5M4FCL3_9ACTN|nr:acetoacetate--CoA ligase [Aeromicrobium ginsengisoli]KAA1396031.1 acetoacetate--CoA ligase [Aeromicrobium ginsengisoli]
MTDILWSPPLDGTSRLERFMQGLDRSFADYHALWAWSVEQPNDFWRAAWHHFDIPADGDPTIALADASMPGAVWFPDVRLNYAEAMLRMPGRRDDDVVVVAASQSRDDVRLTARELRDQVSRARAGLQRAGVEAGDRVAAYSPNIPETLVLLLAAASLGAVFSSCAPEFGTQSVVDRWRQIEPTVLLAVDGYRYGGKGVDRRAEVEAITSSLPSLRTVVWLPYLDPAAPAPEGAITWGELTAEAGPLEFVRLPFAAPLYVLFSSGTTGLPKPIVHGHGGITIEHLKSLAFHHDLGPADRFFWFSTTGWMMWNLLISGLAVGATIVMFDGNPAHPDLAMLWQLAERLEMTYFGTSAPFLLQCRKEGLVPREVADLSRLRGVGSTGAPLPAEGYRWVYDAVSPTAQLGSISGGTDVCSGFVGAAPIVPVYAGEISCRLLGCAVEAYDDDRHAVIGSLGELVITQPMPSMPVGFWGDADGSRYRAAYFEDIPGVWRHGDWLTITERGTCVITGRSDATLNRGGVRLGTAEFYTVVEALPEVADSLVVHLEDDEGGAGQLLLFVVLVEGLDLDEALHQRIAIALRTQLSPRHVPDAIRQVAALPRTLSGKKLEVPVKKILQGASIEDAAAKGALTDPASLDAFVTIRESL